MDESYRNRMGAFLKEINQTPSGLEDQLKLGRSTINNVVKGKTKRLSGKTHQALATAYKWLNIDWLETGRGEMKVSPFSSKPTQEKDKAFTQLQEDYKELLSRYTVLLEKYAACLERSKS